MRLMAPLVSGPERDEDGPANGVTCSVPDTSSTREREHRERLRRQGLRPVQIWVPDVRAPEFVAEARRQSVVVATSENEANDQAFVDAISVPLDADDQPRPT
jgi:hypothetical protein